eukprot:CAMPEP_0119019916 /NCGR_PEP_ID=MMETSP1176-20130426/22964_1 /TAXON_ID=265551 /ORGANISM="Synedropsis recta cf, Strain CCMP1620" /LENGTH=70 /DNA_ID=CAMNT_0006974241 /DNA_START=77 /DNA_END=285 /DNA_ORIENTATION=+
MADDEFFAVPEKNAPEKRPSGIPKHSSAVTTTPAKATFESPLPPIPKTPNESSKAFSLEEANEEIASLLT